MAVDAGLVARRGQGLGPGGGIDQLLLRSHLLRQGLRLHQGIGDLAEAGLDRLLVLRQRDVAVGGGHAQARAQAPTLEDRQVDARDEAPDPGAAVEQAGKIVAGRAEAAGQADRGEERRARRADAGAGGQQPVLGGNHVRAPQQHLGVQARRHRGDAGDRRDVGACGRQQRSVQPRAGQEVERVAVTRDLALEAFDVGTCGRDLGAHLLDLERGGRAQLVALAGQLQRLFVGAQRLLRQPQLLLVGGQGQPGVGDLGHQRQLRRTLRFFRRQVLLQRRLAEVAHAAEQVELERGQADAGGVALAHRDVAAHPLHLRRRAQRRQAVGALDAVLRPRALDVEDGHAQVAVVVQRQRDHLFQPRVGEEVAPADVGHRKGGAAVGTRRARGGSHLGHRPGGGDPGLRFGRGRHQGGAAAGGEDRRQGQREACVLIHARWLPCPRTARRHRPWPFHRRASGSPRRTAG